MDLHSNITMAESTPYDLAFRRRLDTYQPDLWQYLELVPQLPPDASAELLSYLLDLACRAQHVRNIELGRTALLAIPRAWLLRYIPVVAEPLVQLEDDWEYRRLLEVYWWLDRRLTHSLVERGLASSSPAIREVAEEFSERLTTNKAPY